MTRFEGSDPAALKQELGEMRDQMQRGLTEEAIDQFEREEVARLLGSIKRTMVLADAEKGISAMVLFCATEEDARAPSTSSSTRCRLVTAAAGARARTSTRSRSIRLSAVGEPDADERGSRCGRERKPRRVRDVSSYRRSIARGASTRSGVKCARNRETRRSTSRAKSAIRWSSREKVSVVEIGPAV